MAKSNLGGFKLESLMLERLLANPDLFAICITITEASYFAPELKATVDFIKQYYNDYNTIPDLDTINAIGDTELKPASNILTSDQREFLLDQYSEFCRNEAVIEAVLSAGQQIEDGEYAGILENLESALMISIDRDLGINPFEDVEERMQRRHDESPPIPSKLKELDAMMDEGIRRTQLLMLAGGSGSGKSVIMTNMGMAYYEQGYNVLYISLELQETLIGERVEKMVTGWDRVEAYDRLHETVAKVESYGKENNGSFYVKYMESGSNANQIKAYLKEYEAQHKCIPDILIVDYLDLLHPVHMTAALATNVFERDKLAATELRAIGNNPYYNMAMITASQLNRSAVDETDLNHSHIAGGMSKINTVDYYFNIIRTTSMIAEGILELLCLKARSTGSVNSSGRFRWNDATLRIGNMSGIETPIETLSGQIVNNTQEDQNSVDDFDNLFDSMKTTTE